MTGLKNRSIRQTLLKEAMTSPESLDKIDRLRLFKVQEEFGENPLDQVMSIKVIVYLEQSLQQVRNLVYRIKQKEPLLQLDRS